MNNPNLPGTSRIVARATEEFPRHSEGDIITLSDGRLLLAWGRKIGASDFATGTLVGAFSTDAGLSWGDEPHVILEPWDDVTDVMSISLCRSPRGVHQFFLGRGQQQESDTRIYQMLSIDEGRTWSTPVRISGEGYHVVNNARVIRTSQGRLIIPVSYVPVQTPGVFKTVFCLYSDDDGQTWQRSEEQEVAGVTLQEPGVVECADGSIFMIIRTTSGCQYQSRSHDGGDSWSTPVPTELVSPAAPATVVRDPASDDLWIFWCSNPKGAAASWAERNPLSFAVSRDHGHTWSTPRLIEDDESKAFSYISFDIVGEHALLTYYDWSKGQPNFYMCNLRQRTIPLAWLRGEVAPPVFRKGTEPVLQQDQLWEGQETTVGSGLIVEDNRWRLWYTNGFLDPERDTLRVLYAESDDGISWHKPDLHDGQTPDKNLVLPSEPNTEGAYLASVHREAEQLIMFAWYCKPPHPGLYRFVSRDGINFEPQPNRPLIAAWWDKEVYDVAGKGRVSNDAFSVLQNPDGSYTCYAAYMVDASDPRMHIDHDNCPGKLRYIARADSRDGVEWTETKLILQPDYDIDSPDTQFYGMNVFPYKGLYLGVLHTYFVESQIIQPEWAWSRDGWEWHHTRTRCISLGDEGSFDSRMIVFGDLEINGDELVWLYAGANWRHNGFRKGEVRTCIGRATVPLTELDAWVRTLVSD